MQLSKSENGRYESIDGIRGLAALSVVLYHLYGSLKPELDDILPSALTFVFSYGYLGVPVFFVISGFVISHTLHNKRISKVFFANFILRRSIRLDLTYWAAIAIALTLLFVKGNFLGLEVEIPSLSNIALHMFYLQDIAQVDPLISVVYWTLCLEFQFYLFYITSLWVAQRTNIFRPKVFHYCIICSVGVYSLLLEHSYFQSFHPGLFFSTWHYFLLGSLLSHSLKSGSISLVLSWILVELAFVSINKLTPYLFAGILFTAYLLFTMKSQRKNLFLSSRTLQYFGLISYTLYLIHPDIGWKTISLGKSLVGDESGFTAIILLLAGLATSVVAAHALHIFIERPSLALSTKLKSREK